MKNNLIPALKLTLICAVFFSVIYPLILLGIAQLAPNNGEGEIISDNGKIYYANIAQSFTGDAWFSSRPSAVNYNAAGSGGSNKGPSNPDYLKEVSARIDTFLVHNPGIEKSDIPADLVTASGSGLDPDISIEAARIQAKRIAEARDVPEAAVQNVIDACMQKPWLGCFGTEKVNVLKLNVLLDANTGSVR